MYDVTFHFTPSSSCCGHSLVIADLNDCGHTFIGFDMVNPIVKAQQVRIEKFTAEGNPQAPLLALTVWLVSFFFPSGVRCHLLRHCAAGDCTPLI
jgi:hypothetical protein